MDRRALIVFIWLRLCVAQYNICPSSFARSIQGVFGSSNNVQKGISHRIPCPTFRSGERLDGLIWYKGETIDDPSKERLVSRFLDEIRPTSNRYTLSSDSGLVIKSVDKGDEGKYLCEVAPRDTTKRVGGINIQLIGDVFPTSTGATSTSISFQRGRRHTLPCQCAPQTLDAPINVVYWSMGKGITTDTDIIGARFSDGTVLQIQHGADYIIGSDASLTVNSLNDVQDTQRFWCHVFHQDGTLNNCYIDVQITDTDDLSIYHTLRASATSVYLLKGRQQVVPCTSWTSDHATCEMQWLKIDPRNQLLLNYNVSAGDIDAERGFDLASDFGLLIKSVGDVHAGRYSCRAHTISGGNQHTEGYIDARIIGYGFPLDGGSVTSSEAMTFEPHIRQTIHCPARSDVGLTSMVIVIWSFGSPDAQTTTVIGTLNLPDGSKTMSYLGANDCFGISLQGSLLMKNCSQDGDVRYWCHVFPYGDVLIRSYVDVSFKVEDSRKPPIIVPLIAVCVCALAVVTVGCLVWRVRKRDVRDDRERGVYKLIHRRGPAHTFNETELAEQVRAFMKETTSRLPISPWVTGDESYARIDDVYTPLELFVDVSIAGHKVRYRLKSDFEIVDDGITQLSSRHVCIHGSSGCGKTSFLYKMAYDWYKERVDAVLGRKKIVVFLPAESLIKAGNLGKAIVQHMIHEGKERWTDAKICDYCVQNSDEVAILVDDCNTDHDIDKVMNILTNQGLSECQIVLTTRLGQSARETCANFSLRHVTITGFTKQNACKYTDIALCHHYASLDRVNYEYQHKDTSSETMQSTANPGENQESTNSDGSSNYNEHENVQIPQEERNKQFSQDIHDFLQSDILPPKVACLPVNMAALCQLSIWSKGEAFKHDPTMGDLFTWLVRCLFDGKSGSTEGDGADKATSTVNQSDHSNNLSKGQLEILVELGKVILSKMTDCHDGMVALTKDNFLYLFDNGQVVLDIGTKIGLIKHGKDPEPASTVKEGPDTKRISSSIEVHFTLEILRDFCVGITLAHKQERGEEVHIQLMEDIMNIDEFANVFAFACRGSQIVCPALVQNLIDCRKEVARHRNRVPLQQLLELCLLMNYEGRCQGFLNDKIFGLLEERVVHVIGISGHMIRILSYLFEYASHQVAKVQLNPTSVALFRIEKHEWAELRDYYDYFLPGVVKDIDMQATNDLQNTDASRQEHERSKSKDTDTAMFSSDHVPYAMKFSGLRDHPELESTSLVMQIGSDDQKLQDFPLMTKASGTEEDNRQEHRRELGKVRERIESRNENMPMFSPDQSDISVLHTMQSLGLQELLESQSGDCHSSRAASELARCLPGLKMLESLVLIGTILSPEDICAFADNIVNLEKLKKLDFRLNKQFDDTAFEKITSSLIFYCKELTDLRLSLYKVTTLGFDRVRRRTTVDGGMSWLKLKTLYLLHGNPPQTFLKFLKTAVNRKLPFTLRERKSGAQSYTEVFLGCQEEKR